MLLKLKMHYNISSYLKVVYKMSIQKEKKCTISLRNTKKLIGNNRKKKDKTTNRKEKEKK